MTQEPQRPAGRVGGDLRLVYTEYWSGDHRPYRNMMRDPDTDKEVGQLDSDMFSPLLAALDLKDGDEIEISINKTGRRPFGDRRVVLTKPHTYERQQDPPVTTGGEG